MNVDDDYYEACQTSVIQFLVNFLKIIMLCSFAHANLGLSLMRKK